MSVNINIPSYLQSYTGNKDAVTVSGATVAECLGQLVEQFPELDKMLFIKKDHLFDYISIYVNSEVAYADELSKPVRDGDEMQILYILGGG